MNKQNTLYTRLKIIFASSQFLLFCLLAIVIAVILPSIYEFRTDIRTQNATFEAVESAIAEIKSTQVEIIELRREVNQLREDNASLRRIICSQQDQLISLGAKPVQEVGDCTK